MVALKKICGMTARAVKITLFSRARKKSIFAMPVCVMRGSLGSTKPSTLWKLKSVVSCGTSDPALESQAVGPLRAVLKAIQIGPIVIMARTISAA